MLAQLSAPVEHNCSRDTVSVTGKEDQPGSFDDFRRPSQDLCKLKHAYCRIRNTRPVILLGTEADIPPGWSPSLALFCF